MKLPKELTIVTKTSKSLALFLFVSLPVIGFFLGVHYQEMIDMQQYLNQQADLVPLITPTPKQTIDTSNWKTFTSKDALFQISYPSTWTVNYSGGSPEFGSDNKALLQIITWNYSDKKSVEETWQAVGCGGSDPNSGCAPIPNKETSKKRINNYDVYIKVEKSGQMHAYIPNTTKNKTIEINSIFLTDRNVFDQILSTSKFTDQNSVSTVTPTCIPRPACLDKVPRCLIAETSNMCPPNRQN